MLLLLLFGHNSHGLVVHKPVSILNFTKGEMRIESPKWLLCP